MAKAKTQFLPAFGTIAAVIIFILPALAFGQTFGSTIVVTRTPFLSLVAVPASFTFNNIPGSPDVQVSASMQGQDVFSNLNGNLPAATSTIAVRDTRNSGGYSLQVQATNFVSIQNSANIIDTSNLRAVTATEMTATPDAQLVNGVYYLTGYAGIPDAAATETVRAPLTATSTDFSSLGTYDDVGSRAHNAFDAPIDLLSACLPPAQGRVGTMATGIAYTLHIHKYTPPGEYYATITYTLIDDTQDPCP
jgi:hypothetical protein